MLALGLLGETLAHWAINALNALNALNARGSLHAA
jgi:hypothetical protein